jgi:holo-[acyl-carrier protein] synthase
MIIGLGHDITDIRRIEQALARFGERFEQRVFTSAEITLAHHRAKAGKQAVAATFAKRFAAKEACVKALGSGFSLGIFWTDMEVNSSKTGQPELRLSGGALARLHALLPAGTHARTHVSLSDDYPMASAYVILEALPHDR